MRKKRWAVLLSHGTCKIPKEWKISWPDKRSDTSDDQEGLMGGLKSWLGFAGSMTGTGNTAIAGSSSRTRIWIMLMVNSRPPQEIMESRGKNNELVVGRTSWPGLCCHHYHYHRIMTKLEKELTSWPGLCKLSTSIVQIIQTVTVLIPMIILKMFS